METKIIFNNRHIYQTRDKRGFLKFFLSVAITFVVAQYRIVQPVYAQPVMTVFELPLEFTKILQHRIEEDGTGFVVVFCGRCSTGKIRLDVTQNSKVIINGNPHKTYPVSEFDLDSDVTMSAFYIKETKELTRLMVDQ